VPLYEYQCAECGNFEVIQKFSDALLTACPKCGKEVHKLLSAPAIQFKGTGWYITDYARKSSGEGKSKDGGSKDGSSKEGGSKEGGSKDGGAKESTSSESGASKSGAGKESSGSSSGSGSSSKE
jgi:putative FmdB family regulatory protein